MGQLIYSHTNPEYRVRLAGCGRNHGAYHYSCEIVKNIIPRVKTTRPWVTVNIPGRCYDHAIVFIHNNLKPSFYSYLAHYKDLVLVCSMQMTVENLSKMFPQHHVIYLPLSVDVDYVSQFKVPKKTKRSAYAGRLEKLSDSVPEERKRLPKRIDILGGMSREELLKAMAPYRNIYAVGRTAIEAKILGCKVKVYNDLCPDPDEWQVLDNKDAAKTLQEKLNQIAIENIKRPTTWQTAIGGAI